MSEQRKKCAHEGCVCEVSNGQTYCGPYCATAAAEAVVHHEPGPCQCGHPDCRATIQPGKFS